jgi:DNA-binding SARP family transcriptional activator
MGTFRARSAGRTVRVPHSVARLLAVTGLLGPMSRSQVAGLLWCDGTQGRAMANLRTTLSRLSGIDGEFLTSNGDIVELAEDVHLDVHDVIEWVHASIYDTGPVTELSGPPANVGRELLVGWEEDWLVESRDRLRVLQTQALEAVAERLMTTGRAAEALPYALSAVASQPWSESANKLVIEIHARRGNPSSALRHYRRFRAALFAELGVQPGSEVVATIRQLYPFASTT